MSEVVPLIRVVRGQRVILDSDLARLYGVSTSRLNQQVRRNQRKFPVDFAFVLSRGESAAMLSQIVTASRKRNRAKPPIAYTEHGAIMAANILRSRRAETMSVEVVRAFVRLRRMATSHMKIERILRDLESAVTGRLDRHDREIEVLFSLLSDLISEEAGSARRKTRLGSA